MWKFGDARESQAWCSCCKLFRNKNWNANLPSHVHVLKSKPKCCFYFYYCCIKSNVYNPEHLQKLETFWAREKEETFYREMKQKTITTKMASRYCIVSIITSVCLTWRTLKFPNKTPALSVTLNVLPTFRKVFLLPSCCATELDPRMFSL